MSLSDLSDEELIEKLKECHDVSSEYQLVFKVIFDRYDRQAYRFCRHYGLNREDTADVIQEAYIKLYKFVKSFKKGKSFKPWFFKVIFNSIIDRSSYNKKHSSNDLSEMADTLISEKENIFEIYQNKDYISGIITRIPEKLRKVLILKNFNCMDFDEIAEILNIGNKTARKRLKLAYELFKGYLEEDNER